MGIITSLAENFIDKKIPAGLQAIGDASVSYIQGSIDTPYPPASSEGNPPHKRTGNLEIGIDSEVFAQQDKVTIRASREGGDPNVPAYLEGGTSKMAARPFMTPAKFNTTKIVADAVREAMRA